MPSQAGNRMLLQQLRINPEWRDEPPDFAPPPSRAGWMIGGILVVIAALGGGALLLLRGPRFEIDAVTAAAGRSDTGGTAVLQATGYVTARRQATVSAQTTGTLTEVLVDEGDRVTKGQVLARLESTAQKASLAQSEAQLQAARALLAQAKAQLKQEYRDLVRSEDLVARHLISMQALETARTLVETQVSQVESQRRQVELAEASLKGAQVMLDYTTVRAPFSGIVVAQPAQEGELTSPMSPGADPKGSGIATIVDMDSLDIEVDVNEANLKRIQPNQPVEAVPDAYPDWRIPAHVVTTIPTADRNTATFKVRIAIDQKDPRILPEMGVRVSFLAPVPKRQVPGTSAARSRTLAAGVFVPGSAIVERSNQSVVFAVDGERVRERPITLVQTYGDLRFIEGIETGVQVVQAPPAQMQDGARVAIRSQQ